MEKKNIWKKTVHSIKQNFITDQVFWENEIKANLFVARCLVIVVFFLGVSWILNLCGVFSVDKDLFRNIFFVCLLLLLVPIFCCTVTKGAKRWIKYFMMIAVISILAYIDRVMTFNVPLLIVLPVVFSCRYYSSSFTVQTAIGTSIAFLISTYFGAKDVIGYPDMNFVTGSSSEYMKNVMLQSFLPKWMLFVIATAVCFEIARCGKNMVLKQDKITQFNTRVETELNLANKIQKGALPPFSSLPENFTKHFELSARMTPAKEVGGDFYNFVEIDESHIALMIADVADKGIGAALYMMMSKFLLENKLLTSMSPGEILAEVNGQLFEKKLKGMFVTVWLGILDLNTGEMITANAGHEYPALKRNGEDFELYKDKHGLVLGGLPGITYIESKIQFNKGDVLFVYTDGVAEANNPSHEQFGLTRMIESLNAHCEGSMDEMINGVQDDVNQFAAEAPQFDDTTMMAIKYLG